MNSKLRDLQIQAFAECKTFEDGKFKTDEVFERFAQLLVKECTSIVNSLEQYQGQGDCATAEYIKEHFGIK